MTPSVLTSPDASVLRTKGAGSVTSAADKQAEGIKQRFEQMLWAEMLTHAGLEKAFTQGGGEAASAFSRYVVEEIAKDLAAQHPLGLTDKVEAPSTSRLMTEQEDPS